MSYYIMKTGDAGAQRLEMVNEYYNPLSKDFLLACGLKPGMQVLELGCGLGVMSAWIADIVGPTGKLIAIDQSEQQLDIARRNIQSKYAEFIKADVLELDLPSSNFDFIYSRLLLMHIKQREKLITNIITLLKKTGIYASEEWIGNSINTVPATDIGTNILAIFTKQGEKYGVDFNLGEHLYGLLTSFGLKTITARFSQPIITTSELQKYYRLAIHESVDSFLANKIISEEELAALINKIENMNSLSLQYGLFHNMAQVAIQK